MLNKSTLFIFLVSFNLAAQVHNMQVEPDDIAKESNSSSTVPLNNYIPIEGGWRIVLKENKALAKPAISSGKSRVDSRLHRRPLYPPADRTMIWNKKELTALDRVSFRPLVLAYNEPRFLFDYHSAGGLLGHLIIGLKSKDKGMWLHQWSDLDVSYTDGHMEYIASDPDFPGVTVMLSASSLSASAGLIVKVVVEDGEGLDLVWAYGGASAYFTNWKMDAPEFAFSPEQCAKDSISWSDNIFSLFRSFDKSDVYMDEPFAAARYLPDWKAHIQGGSSWKGKAGFGSPYEFNNSPQELCANAQWIVKKDSRKNSVAIQAVQILQNKFSGYITIGMGGNIEKAVENPKKAWSKAIERNISIANRIVTHTPDPRLDAAIRMMSFATEGTWGDLSILHGAWSWRFAFLGWRGWYGPVCYGWTDRVKESIDNHMKLSLIEDGEDKGALGFFLEGKPYIYYNMNEVFLDQVRQYFDYTNDTLLMRRIFPVLKSILKWEDRRLQPGNEHLYESSLNTWISDSHWYIGGRCSQASAYMLGANRFMAEIAERLGKDPAPFRKRAEQIRKAMQDKLWMPDKGVFAEYLDTRGYRMLHTEPELSTLYHSAEFGAADTRQIAQMLKWADTHLKTEKIPGGGELIWSSNWAPNHARSYTHSTHELAYAEQMNFALTNYLAGRADKAYALIQSSLTGIFSGPTPGGLSCHTYVDGTQRQNDEFADAISMFGRTVTEGLFGIVPKRPDGIVILSPQFPKDWDYAEIKSPAFSYKWQRSEWGISIEWTSPQTTGVSLRLPVRTSQIKEILIDNNPVKASLEKGFAGVNWLLASIPPSRSGKVTVHYKENNNVRDITADTQQKSSEITTSNRRRWSPPDVKRGDLSVWKLMDIKDVYNASVTGVLQRVLDKAEPPQLPALRVNFEYWKDHLLSRNKPVSDSAWRAKVNRKSIAWTIDNIPFMSSKTGPNIAVATLAGGFPHKVTIPVNEKGAELYLMLSGMTFPNQSHVTNIRIVLNYNDGTVVKKDFVNPFDIGDCWSSWCGRYHDNAVNGFENIGGRKGPMGSAEVEDLTKPVAVDTEAHLVRFQLKKDVTLTSITMEAIANDAIFGIMGATILK